MRSALRRGVPVYSEGFSPEVAEHWDVQSNGGAAQWIEEGEYHIQVKLPDFLVIARDDRGLEFDDFRLDVDLAHPQGSPRDESGVVFRYTGPDNFYLATIDGRGALTLRRRFNGVWQKLATDVRWVEVDPGTERVHLTVIADHERLLFGVQGSKVLEETDSCLTRGQVGLYAAGDDLPDFHASFDNLEVWPLGQ